MLTFYAGSLPHFANHLAPIYSALPESHRENFHARGRALTQVQKYWNIEAVGGLPRHKEMIVVASYEDHRAVKPAPTVFVNHGVGQTYFGDSRSSDHPSYSGGRDRERAVLFLCPSQRDAETNQLAYPAARSVAVGVPYLDGFRERPKRHPQKPVVVISFHADAHVVNETRWSFPHYKQTLIDLARRKDDLPFTLIGHGHPRMTSYLRTFWGQLNIPFIEDFMGVLAIADCYVCDNSSSLYEAAAVDIPVVTLSAPWYRRDVHHGLRFWEAIPGLHIEEPGDLELGIINALADPQFLQELRQAAVQVAYDGLVDGHATDRAVAALLELADG